MNNEGRLYSQVAAEAGVPIEKAMVACYLVNLSRDGKSLDEAAELLRKPRAEARDYARDWGITFADYSATYQPLVLTWVKEKRGRWVLALDGALIAEAVSDGKGAYDAFRLQGDKRLTPAEGGSSAEVAMRRLSVRLERDAVEIFGVDDVRIEMVDGHGELTFLAPKRAENPAQLVKALAAA